MPSIRVDWTDTDHNILLFTFVTDWTWQDFISVGNQSMEMMSSVDYPVIQIFDMRSAHNLPRNAFSGGRQLLGREPHRNLHKAIIVGMNGYFNAIYRAFEKMLPASWIDKWNMSFVDSLEEAVELAQKELSQINPRP